MTMLRNKVFWILLIAITFSAGYIWRASRPAAPMRTAVVTKKKFQKTVIMNGNLDPIRKTIVVAPFNGFIRKVHVQVGQMVKAGDPVVTLTQTLSSDEPIHPIRSGIPGRVMQIMHTEGEYMKADDPQNFILRIDDQSEYYIDAYAPELSVTYVAVGQPVELTSAALQGRVYHGVVKEISEAPRVEEGWKNQGKVEYLVRILMKDKTNDLFSGLSFSAQVITAEKENALVLPIEFLIKDKEQYFVYDRNGVKKPVKIGMVNDSDAEIVEGVSVGEVIRGADMLELLGDQNVTH